MPCGIASLESYSKVIMNYYYTIYIVRRAKAQFPSGCKSHPAKRAGASVLPLPPYSPDFTPIEEMFSKFKEFLRRIGARAKGAPV
jgi:hypothetical protein